MLSESRGQLPNMFESGIVIKVCIPMPIQIYQAIMQTDMYRYANKQSLV